MGDTYRGWGKFEDATKCFEEANSRYAELGQVDRIASVWWSLGLMHRQRGDFDSAVKFLIQSRDQYAQLDRLDNVANVLWGLGLTHRSHGHYMRAIEFLIQSRDQCAQLDRPNNVANLWDYLGGTYRECSKFDEAITCYEEARSHYATLRRQSQVALMDFHLGLTNQAREDYNQAVDFLTKSRNHYAELGLSKDVANLWNRIGEVEFLRGDLSQARISFEHALEIGKPYEYVVPQARALAGLGVCLERSEKYAEATAQFEQAIKLYQIVDEPELLAKAEIGLCRLLWREGKKSEAQQAITEALQRLDERNMLRDKALIQKDLGEFFQTGSERELARAHRTSALQVFEKFGIEYEAREVETDLEELA